MLHSQLDDIDRDVIIGDSATRGNQNVMVSNGPVDREFIFKIMGGFSTTIENMVSGQRLEKCFNEEVDRFMGNIVDGVEDGIQNATLTAIEILITPMIELVLRSKNVSPGRDVASIAANSERGDRKRITASFENLSHKDNTFHELNTNDGTRANIPDEVSELSVPRTHCDLPSHTHHSYQIRRMIEIFALFVFLK